VSVERRGEGEGVPVFYSDCQLRDVRGGERRAVQST
jgi:hypothetical protein